MPAFGTRSIGSISGRPLQNVLVEPLEKKRTLSFDFSIGHAKELHACLFSTPFRLLVPISVAKMLGRDMECGTDYLPYDTIENAGDLSPRKRQRGMHAYLCIRTKCWSTPPV